MLCLSSSLFFLSSLGDDPLSKRIIPAFCSRTDFFIQETLTGQALHAWWRVFRAESDTGAQEPQGSGSLGGLQCWLCSQEPGLRTYQSWHLISSYTPLSLDFSICTMGIKLIYFSGLLEEFKVIIQVYNHLYEFLGLRCVSEFLFLF